MTITVQSFAEQIGVQPETLLRQLADAGVADKQVQVSLKADEKEQLFRFLRTSTGGDEDAAGRKKITLKLKSTSQVTHSTRTGGKRTVQVEVRRKRTFVKRPEAEPVVEAPVEVAPPAPVAVVETPAAPVAAAPVASA